MQRSFAAAEYFAGDKTRLPYRLRQPCFCFFGNKNRLIKTEFSIDRPIVAVGAPAGAWIGKVAEKMKTKAVIPEHGEVANAYGAAIAAHN